MKHRVPFVCLLAAALAASSAAAQRLNGFQIANATVPKAQIRRGGPPRDGIPAIRHPRFVTAAAAHELADTDRVLGITRNGIAHAYPIRILNWHELVNDDIGGAPVLISYCPLCGTGMAFDANVQGKKLTFGVSGLLYNSDVLFYDRQSESLWSQIARRAVSGPMVDTRLQQLPLQHTTWAKWREHHPDTKVLSFTQGFRRNYADDPYAGYENSPRLFFKVAAHIPRDYHPKERVLGVVVGDAAKAYPFTELRDYAHQAFDDRLGDQTFTIHWDAATDTAGITGTDGRPLASTVAFWFAWYVFHPQTAVFHSRDAGS